MPTAFRHLMDKRKQVIKERLSRLGLGAVQRIKDNIDQVCLDTFNYDAESGTYCVLAIGMGLDEKIKDPTQQSIADEIGKIFQPVNSLKGVPGEFFRDNRRADLLLVCDEILSPVAERQPADLYPA